MKTLSVLAILALLGVSIASAQPAGSQTGNVIGGADVSTTQKSSLTARLVNQEKKAAMKAATVEAEATGIEITDADATGEIPKEGQGHFHYRIDNGPIIATTAKKMSFHELTPGSHTITVVLAGNDHKPLGQEQTLSVEIK